MGYQKKENAIPKSRRALVGRTKEGIVHQGIARKTRELACDRNTAEAESGLDVENIFNQMCRRQHDGVGNEAILVSLDGANHVSLRFRGLVVVDDADTSQKLED
jgi:hypothetical protein